MKTRVVHCKLEPYDVYIGRPGPWGNPWSHRTGTAAQFKVDTVEEAIVMYREDIERQIARDPTLFDLIVSELKGKVLGCWCKTKKDPDAPCHGDVLVELVERCR